MAPKKLYSILACAIAVNSYATDHVDGSKIQKLSKPPVTKFEFPDNWRVPVTPFQLADHTWYIGTEGLSSVLIKTEAGAILIDTGLPGASKMLIAHMQKLGVAPSDLKWILHSHAHEDHVGSHAALRIVTKAPIATNAESAVLLGRGGTDDIHFGDRAAFEPVQTDRFLMDGETITLGNITLTAHFTPAHTPGSMSWTWTDQRDGKPVRIAYVDSLSAPGYKLMNNPRYPHIIEDYQKGIAAVRSLPCDLLLTPHPEASGWVPANTADPHPNPMTCLAYADGVQQRFTEQLQKEQKKQ
jgi:metallo-beta-lactamase class B